MFSILHIIVVTFISTNLSAAEPKPKLTSPFPSTVVGLTIPNAHVVARKEGEVLRGMSPEGHVHELVKRGVTDVLIFRNADIGSSEAELTELKKNGYSAKQIHQIAFKWRDITNETEACEQVVDALRILEQSYTTRGKSVYFHCTVGEDRTGLLAGLFRMVELKGEGWTARAAFDKEMCLNGFAAGNPRKPQFVKDAVQNTLTPLFLKLATLVDEGKLSAGKLDKSVCAGLPKKVSYKQTEFRCSASPRYRN